MTMRRHRKSRTREEYVEHLRWNVRDATEALKASVSMRNWAGVMKYARELQGLERKLYDAETARPRSHRVQEQMREERFRRSDTETRSERNARLRRAGYSVASAPRR